MQESANNDAIGVLVLAIVTGIALGICMMLVVNTIWGWAIVSAACAVFLFGVIALTQH